MKKKIFVRLVGGYGNQLFIYAFGLALAIETNKDLIIDNISGFGNSADEYKSVYALGGLKTKGKLINQTFFKFFLANKYFWYLSKKFKLSYVEESIYKYNHVNNSKKSFFEGYWQSYLYFDKYRDEIKKCLSLDDQNNNNITNYKSLILKTKKSVAIGMRFYEETISAPKHHLVKDGEYYHKAIKFLEKKTSNLKYFIFSTDIVKAKRIINNYGNIDATFIDPNRSKQSAKYDLYLMSLCKHYIISNGTFYWWAAYLGENKNSFVLAPKIGFVNKNCIPPNWIKI